MLLGRTAGGLYWMYRYIERAENTARIVDAGLRMALTRTSDAPAEWSSVLVSTGSDAGYRQKYDAYAAEPVSDYLLRDRDNPSSVLSCIEAARSNARMVRTALTREAWESVNGAWLSIRHGLAQPVPASDLPAFLDHVKRETALMLGTFYSTMLRNEIFDFAQIGAFIERADTRRESSMSNITCFCRRCRMSARFSTTISGSRSCAASPRTARTAGCMTCSTSR